MRKNVIAISAALAALAMGGSACAETVWKPPAEISDKAQAQAGDAAAAPTAAAPAAAAPAAESKADKEKNCKEQAEAKGLKGKAKKQFKAECLKS